jgi:hypothetical protein
MNNISTQLIIMIAVWILGVACSSEEKDQSVNTDSDTENDSETSGESTANFRHINIWDFGRGLEYVDPSVRGAAVEFFASHVDIAEVANGEFVGELRRINPDIQVFHYDLDIAPCQHTGCSRNEDTAEIYQGEKESFYLHFSEDTQFETTFIDGTPVTISVPGCNGDIRPECRMQTVMWLDYRWVHNQKDPEFKIWMANRLLDSVEPFNAVFLDEHGPGLPITWPENFVGGGILEYGGRTIREIEEDYNADLVDTLAVYKETFAAQGKYVIINGGEYSLLNKPVMDQVKAAGGTHTEYLHRPDRISGVATFKDALDDIDELVAAGEKVDLADTPCRDVEGDFGFTRGNDVSAFARWQIWRLAMYYLAREMPAGPSGQGMVYFDPGLCMNFSDPSHALDFIDEWLPAYEYDVGNPDGPRQVELFTSGTVTAAEAAACDGGETGTPTYGVFSRYYDQGRVLILVRPKSRWDCHKYDDETGVSVSLSPPRRMLMSDGSLTDPMSTIQLRNAEAAIMVE